MNASYLFAGTVSTNPVLLLPAILIILAWRIAGYWGLTAGRYRCSACLGSPARFSGRVRRPRRPGRDDPAHFPIWSLREDIFSPTISLIPERGTTEAYTEAGGSSSPYGHVHRAISLLLIRPLRKFAVRGRQSARCVAVATIQHEHPAYPVRPELNVIIGARAPIVAVHHTAFSSSEIDQCTHSRQS
jgi:hypothetical protein